MCLALQVCQHSFRRLTALEYALEETDGLGSVSHRRRAAKGEAHPISTQVVRLLRKLRQQTFACLRRQPVGDAHQVSLFAAGGFQHLFHRHCRAEKDSTPASGFGQPQEVHHPGYVDALTQRAGNDCSHGLHRYSTYSSHRSLHTPVFVCPIHDRSSNPPKCC